MNRVKKVPVLGLIGLLILVSLLGSTWQGVARGAQPEPSVLARVEVVGRVDELGLPVYAHLQDAAGNEYALVIAPVSQLDQSGASYTILDAEMDGTPYLIALERQPGARQQAPQVVNVLHDDGLHIIVRVMPEEGEALAEMGFELQWLDEVPMVLGVPARLAAEPLAIEYDPVIAEMINQVQQNTVYTYDGNLSGEWAVSIGGSNYTITTRYTRSGTPIQKATQYMYEFMQSKGLAVSYHDWTYSTTSNRNVIGVKTGTTRPNEIVLITGHLDDVPTSGLAPGADDNASGSVGVMMAAEILSQYQFQRTLRFVFFTGEEQGLYGSNRYASKVYSDGDNIVAVYNMDMIAWDSTGGPVLRLHTRTTGSSGYAGDRAIADTFVDVVNAYGLSSNLTPVIDTDGESASDHASFWNRGYSAVLAIEDDVNDFCAYYHTANDKLSTLNMTYFTNYTKASIGTAAHLAMRDSGTPSTPTPTPTNTATPTNTPTPTAMPTQVPGQVFFDDLETNKGWTVNPAGTDTATLGKWERANPEDTNSSGAKQLGTTTSGSYDLVTGPLAGSSAGSYDIDGGVTSIRSPNITLPSGQSLTLSLKYYLAHGSNSSSADYLRVKAVGATTTTVLEELGAADDDDAAWATFTGSLDAFAGQTIYLLIEAADASSASLVEAAVDDVSITASGTPGPTPTPTNTPTPTATPTNTPTPTATPTSGPGPVFSDDLETNKGWTVNPAGTDTATTGQWERANPEDTTYNGAKQLGTTASGSYDLVTGPLAGSSAGSYDIDGGVTSIRSPNITLPSGQSLTLTLKYYLAHANNSSSADYLRVKVVGTTTTTVLEELGAADDDDAAWATLNTSLSAYAGQTVYLLIEAADASSGSLVEAAIDDVLIQ